MLLVYGTLISLSNTIPVNHEIQSLFKFNKCPNKGTIIDYGISRNHRYEEGIKYEYTIKFTGCKNSTGYLILKDVEEKYITLFTKQDN